MEILRSVLKRGGRTAVIVIVLAAAALAAFFCVRGAAYADNSSDIGAGSGAVTIVDVTPTSAFGVFHSGGLWNRDDSGEYYVLGGVTYRITVPLNAGNIYVAYDLDLNADMYGLRGDREIDGVPYMLYDGAQGNNRDLVSGETEVGLLYPISWTAEESSSENRRFEITLAVAGELMVYVELAGEGDEVILTESQIVDNLDYRHPEPVGDAYGRYISGLLSVSDDGTRSFRVSVSFTDNFPASVPYSACSGISSIWILRFDEKLSVGGDSAGDSDDVTGEDMSEYIDEHTVWSENFTTLTRNHTSRFDITQDGFYYWYAMDSLGNSALGLLSNDRIKIETDPAYDITGYAANGSEIALNVEDNVLSYRANIAAYDPSGDGGTVNPTLYSEVSEAFANLDLAFRDGTDRETVTEMYWSFVNGVYARFRAAVEQGRADVDFVVNNSDLVSGEFSSTNLSLAVDSVGGDVVELVLNLALLPDSSDAARAAVAAVNAPGAKSVIRVNYTATLNGASISADKLSASIRLRFDYTDEAEYYVVYDSGDGYRLSDITNGTSFLITDLNGTAGNLYLVRVASEDGDDLLPLWIALGIGIPVIIAAAVALAVLYKKGRIGKKRSSIVSEPESGETGAEISEEPPAISKPGANANDRANNKKDNKKKKK